MLLSAAHDALPAAGCQQAHLFTRELRLVKQL
jgi:hypothetical protein